MTSRDKEIHEREEELKKVQDLHNKDKKTMEEIETQLKKTMEERALLTEQIFREKEMAAEADDVSFVTLFKSILTVHPRCQYQSNILDIVHCISCVPAMQHILQLSINQKVLQLINIHTTSRKTD